MSFFKENWHKIALFVVAIVVLWQGFVHFRPSGSMMTARHSFDSWCPLPETDTLVTTQDTLIPSSELTTDVSLMRQVERLSAAVKCPTETFDDNGDVDVDPRWKTFDEFHKVLKDLFPLVHKEAELDPVNRYGLVFTLKGASKSLKPIMLTAHQDVVPASSLSKWTHPPFEPYYDSQYLWGRGSSDCKNNLIGIISVVEKLLEQDWKPRRTIVQAFGFDEETGGVRGAAHIAKHLEKRWGHDGFAMILDEGGMGLTTVGEYVYARPAVAEKGYMDAELTLEVSGGHSSRPPSHSGIGIMAEMIVALEQNPYEPVLTGTNPLRGYLECQAKYTPHELEPWLRTALERDDKGSDIAERLADERGPSIRFSMQTSQAVDIIRGGNKVNALPQTVSATVNYRIAPHDSLEIIKSKIAKLVEPICRRHDIKVEPFATSNSSQPTTNDIGSEPIKSFLGTLYLKSLNDLSPSPISPTNIQNPVWHTFSATIRQVFEDTKTLAGKKVIPVGDIMQGNTDTIQYWNLTRNIYRFSPAREGTRFGMHTIDEHIDMMTHLEGMRLYYDMIRNFDAADV